MKLRRLAAASATAAALFGVTAAAFPAAAQAAPLPALTSKALTGTALTARYQANDQAIGRDARAARQAGNIQLASALRTLETKQVLFYSPAGEVGVVLGNLATASRVAIRRRPLTHLSPSDSRGSAPPGGGAADLAAEAGLLLQPVRAWPSSPGSATSHRPRSASQLLPLATPRPARRPCGRS